MGEALPELSRLAKVNVSAEMLLDVQASDNLFEVFNQRFQGIQHSEAASLRVEIRLEEDSVDTIVSRIGTQEPLVWFHRWHALIGGLKLPFGVWTAGFVIGVLTSGDHELMVSSTDGTSGVIIDADDESTASAIVWGRRWVADVGS